MNNKKIWIGIKEYFLITLGVSMYVMGWIIFLIPNNMIGGGVTVLKAQGWFTKADKNVLLILINQRQLSGLSQVIKEIDPRAFMSISPTHNVYGEGFEEIKTGVHLKMKHKHE